MTGEVLPVTKKQEDWLASELMDSMKMSHY